MGFNRRAFMRNSTASALTLGLPMVPQLARSAEELQGASTSVKAQMHFQPFAFTSRYRTLEDEYFKSLNIDTELANGPWEMLLKTLARYVSGGDPKNVQMVTAPRPADWNDKTFGQYRLSKILGDSMPAWGAVFDPKKGNSFGLQYAIYLQNIDIPAPDVFTHSLATERNL